MEMVLKGEATEIRARKQVVGLEKPFFRRRREFRNHGSFRRQIYCTIINQLINHRRSYYWMVRILPSIILRN